MVLYIRGQEQTPADDSSWSVHGQLDKQQPPSSPLRDIFERSSPWAAPDAHRLNSSLSFSAKAHCATCLVAISPPLQKTLCRPLYWHQGKSEFAGFFLFTLNSGRREPASSASQPECPCESILGRNTEMRKNGARRRESGGDFPDIFKNRKGGYSG